MNATSYPNYRSYMDDTHTHTLSTPYHVVLHSIGLFSSLFSLRMSQRVPLHGQAENHETPFLYVHTTPL